MEKIDLIVIQMKYLFSSFCFGFNLMKKFIKTYKRKVLKTHEKNKIQDFFDSIFIKELNKYQNFVLACATECEIKILDQLYKKQKIKDSDCANTVFFYGLAMACSFNGNIKILEYLFQKINKIKFGNPDVNALYFISACKNNENLHIIEYLSFKLNVYNLKNEDDFVILWICSECVNTNIIKFLIEEIKMNVQVLNQNDESCFDIAQENNAQLCDFFCQTNFLVYMNLSNFQLNKHQTKIHRYLKLLNQ